MSGDAGNPAMPVIPDLRDFDPRSGNLLERFIFNNRAPVLLLCLIATIVLGFFATQLDVNASFERMIPSSSPYIRNYLANKAELPGWATRSGSSSRTSQATFMTPSILKPCASLTMRCISFPASTDRG